MFRTIPRAPLILGLAGLLPFLWGAATVAVPGLAEAVRGGLGPRMVGVGVLIAYGTVILSFMSGVLWGFAARGGGRGADGGGGWRGYALSVLPALWAFFMVGGGGAAALSALIVGFLVLLVMDAQFAAWGLVPAWWLRLRLILTGGVVACLIVGLYV